jgi:TetR/AcrR family transcriptional regulator, regulator of cefoperazone and chloramphenicol sensitivity
MPDLSRSRPRPNRSDGEQSRERLMRSALALFAAHGFARASTREIAEAAGTNLAAISYYFGDKAGLYRAVFTELQRAPEEEIARYGGAELSLQQALRGLYTGFVEPLRQGDDVRLSMKLHMREMLEPTGLWEQEIHQGIQPMHDALAEVLRRHFGLAKVDNEVRRLAICLAALGVHLHVGREVTDALAPQLNAGRRAHDLWLDRLVLYGEAMVEAEARRRQPSDSAHTLPQP